MHLAATKHYIEQGILYNQIPLLLLTLAGSSGVFSIPPPRLSGGWKGPPLPKEKTTPVMDAQPPREGVLVAKHGVRTRD